MILVDNTIGNFDIHSLDSYIIFVNNDLGAYFLFVPIRSYWT